MCATLVQSGLEWLCQSLGVNSTNFSSRATAVKGTEALISPIAHVSGTFTALQVHAGMAVHTWSDRQILSFRIPCQAQGVC